MSYATASSWVDALSIAMVAASILALWTRSLGRLVLVLAVQSSLLAVAGLVTGIATGDAQVVVAAVVVLAVKAVILPGLLWVVIERTAPTHAVEAYLGSRTSAALGIAVALLLARLLAAQPFRTEIGADRVLATSVSLMVIGLMIMISRRQAVAQIAGFLALENGMALAALTATYGMPLAIELGVLFDLLIVVLVAFVYSRRIHAAFGSLDTQQLRKLRG